MACSAATAHGAVAADSVDTLSQTLRGVSVSGRRVRSYLGSEGGASVVSMKLMDEMPRILGNADPMRYAQMLPGVQTNAEYDAGLHIRGSESSHNQVAIDGVPLYNAAHLLGFFSVFNPTHFSSMKLSETASAPSAPNRLGGILNMRTGGDRPQTAGGDAAVGPMSSQGTLRVPTGKRSWLTASARAAYLNLLYSQWLEIDGTAVDYFFHDYNLNWTWQPDGRNRVWIEAYYGGDNAGLGEGTYGMNTSLKWGNAMAAAHWLHRSDGLTLRQSLYFTASRSRFALDQTTVSVRLPSSIADIGYKMEAAWGRWEAGIDAAGHFIRPQEPQVSGDVASVSSSAGRQRALEVAAWAGYSLPLRSATLSAGLRPTLYATTRGSSFSADPTVALAWRLSPGAGLKLSAWARHQYLIKTGFSDIGLPTEFWFAAGYGQRAQRSLNASADFEVYLGRRAWRLSGGVYYKRLYHQVEYRGNVFDFVYSDYSLDNTLLAGDGHNYGLTLMLERRKGRITGWLSYAFTRAWRQFPGSELSGWYPANHDRPHELNAVATFRPSARWSFGASLVAASGTPFTRVRRFYVLSDHTIAEYGPHNGERLSPYVRLDLSVNYDFRTRGGRRSGVNLSLYNAIAHDNVLFYRIKVNEYEYAYRPFAFALRVLPSVNYYFSF